MEKKMFVSASEMAESLEISRAHAYKIIKKLNSELEQKGFMTLTGKVSRIYFEEKFYGIVDESR
ncbi:helix-turn-helix domain-containing protein [Chakrabartyella piscis]|uniref:helix-turn-helix domain-containing protein n=1 Tax=Chakrabartyella piscis TaxID=2918914 RepID=UPI002958B042|nr:HTH domain-containing protein [Chakrabartyella piscis]